MTKTLVRAVLIVTCLGAGGAFARSGGITGYSGKDGQFCNSCHTGGAVPTVEISGPTELEGGTTGTYTLTITGGAAVEGGFNVAVDSAAATLIPGTGQRLSGGELTHTAPRPFTSGTAVFTFELRAPTTSGDITIFGAGNSTNNSSSNSGDRAATDQFLVSVSAGLPVLDAGMPEQDAGAPEEDAGTVGEDAGMSEEDAGTGGETGEDAGTGGGENPDPVAPNGDSEPTDVEARSGCGAAGLALAPIALGAWILHLRRRRRED